MKMKQAQAELRAILHDMECWHKSGYRSPMPAPKSPGLKVSNAGNHQKPFPKNPLKPRSKAEMEAVDSVPGQAQQAAEPFEIEASEQNSNFQSLEEIAESVSHCQRCTLHLLREKTVPGTGSVGAKLMVITQPPHLYASPESGPYTREEAEYLEKWLLAVDLDLQKDVFITPAVKCPTAAGRPANKTELHACSNYLMAQIRTVSPCAILALGSSACAALTGDQADFSRLVSLPWTWEDKPALVLWRPAEVLAKPQKLRRPVWESLKGLRMAWDELSGN